jgi:diguanylate cyclase (GGDEF)-like protein
MKGLAMKIIPDKILLVTGEKSKDTISNSIKGIPGLDILEADSEKKIFELIYTHHFVLAIIEKDLPIDIYEVGTMFLSHKATYNTPLLIIDERNNDINDNLSGPEEFLTTFKTLQVDYITKPFNEQLIRAKIKIFFDLFKQKNAVAQSIDELDKAYKKIVDQHDLVIKEAFSKKELVNRSTIAANQIQQPLRSLQGNIYQLIRSKNITPKIKSNLTSIKTATERISVITTKLLTLPGKSKIVPAKNISEQEALSYEILYIEDSDEDFSIFNHFIKSVIKCKLVQAKTIEQGLELIEDKKFDLIFINYRLPDGSGLDFLTQLNSMRTDIPIVFTLDRPNINIGEALAKGAFNYYLKEEISSTKILTIIHSTLAKSKSIREVEDVQNTIVMIARKDYLTRLYNRESFEEELTSEISKAKRYNLPLSILIVDFDKFKPINKAHGYKSGDIILSNSASLIQSMVRNDDMVCRYGGEEFGIILSNTPLSGAKVLAKRIKARIADHEFEKDSTMLKITVSIGIAAYDKKHTTSFSGLVEKALDAAKSAIKQGGNRVETLI